MSDLGLKEDTMSRNSVKFMRLLSDTQKALHMRYLNGLLLSSGSSSMTKVTGREASGLAKPWLSTM